MEQSLQFVAPGGRLVFVGLCADKIAIDDPLLHRREIALFASRNSAHQFPRIIGMIERGEIDTSSWIGERLSLEEVPEKFAGLRARPELVKAVVHVGPR
jgi:threonine dehydrogenase-like Zn-dependent dehydrogenase